MFVYTYNSSYGIRYHPLIKNIAGFYCTEYSTVYIQYGKQRSVRCATMGT